MSAIYHIYGDQDWSCLSKLYLKIEDITEQTFPYDCRGNFDFGWDLKLTVELYTKTVDRVRLWQTWLTWDPRVYDYLDYKQKGVDFVTGYISGGWYRKSSKLP